LLSHQSVLSVARMRDIPAHNLHGQENSANDDAQCPNKNLPHLTCRTAMCDRQPAQEDKSEADNLLCQERHAVSNLREASPPPTIAVNLSDTNRHFS
jgi:hypothetical protein